MSALVVQAVLKVVVEYLHDYKEAPLLFSHHL